MKRSIGVEELMDADDLPADTYAAVVGDLAKVNVVTMAARPTLSFLDRLVAVRNKPLPFRGGVGGAASRPGEALVAAPHPNPSPEGEGLLALRILDVGFGDGDMLRRIARWAATRGLTVELVGVDLNPRSELAARAHTPADLPIRYVTGDYQDLAGERWDAVISSLVAHHMTPDQLVAFLSWMEAHARAGWLVNDLHRHWFAHRGFPLLARLARWHPIVRHDGTLSVARSYTPAEWPPLLAEAGVTDARVFRAFPFRLCVERVR